ncbi:hypothetical protein [Natrarchaeobius chitinivorans]|uniref:Uncharacterized protein n=1 Tax=Natrarchaeobius chitinivorans TaxID=1679083 RepID=A0A3N6MMR9_NATCH|nr:hypothetical protein [Natrarchaeobius chitinivorans]RQG95766.1 hypothetical protein EA473_06135 [Natrarchaeobius chitinivorans]
MQETDLNPRCVNVQCNTTINRSELNRFINEIENGDVEWPSSADADLLREIRANADEIERDYQEEAEGVRDTIVEHLLDHPNADAKIREMDGETTTDVWGGHGLDVWRIVRHHITVPSEANTSEVMDVVINLGIIPQYPAVTITAETESPA